MTQLFDYASSLARLDQDDHWAIIRDDEMLKHYYVIGEERNIYGILGSYHDRFEFLRDRGYVDVD